MGAIHALPEGSSNQALAKQQAFELYVTSSLTSIKRIADRVELPVELVKQWIADERWSEKRAQHLKGPFEERLKAIENRKLSAKEKLEICAAIQIEIKKRTNESNARSYDSASLKRFAQTLEKLSDIEAEQYKILGV